MIGPTLGGIISEKYSFEGACMVREIYGKVKCEE